MPKLLNNDQFIERSNKNYNNKYNYSESKYINQSIKVKIICPIHGSFFQDPKSHMKGVGCPKCGINRRTKFRSSNTNEFIQKSNKIHKNFYNYSKSNYVNNYTKITIICPIHGKFLQSPASHLRGAKCPKCSIKRVTSLISYNTNEFIQKSNKIHKNFYNYSKSNYKNSNTKIIIICPIHGEFFQLPLNHFKGEGCYKCGREKSGKKCTKTTIQFIKDSNKNHNNFFNYSKSNYINANTKIEIICPKHGSFFQDPHHHTNGKNGCPKCNNIISKPETEFLNYLNIPNTKENRQVKIGRKKVDGLKDNIVYEFLGDYWHGNPNVHNLNDFNKVCKKTFGELYENTKNKFILLKNNGYKIKYIWENDWKNFKKGIDQFPKIITN